MRINYLKRPVTDAERKLLLLYSLEKLRLCTDQELWPFAARQTRTEYLPFCLDLGELRASGEVAGSRALYVTEKGRQTLRLFGRRIPASLRKKIDGAAPGYRRALQEKKQTPVGYEAAAPGRFRMYGKVVEGEAPTLTLRLDTDDRALCGVFLDSFREKAAALLGLLYRLEDADAAPLPEGETEAAEPGAPVVKAFSETEYAAAVCLREGGSELRLSLLFPDAPSAARWARAADSACADVTAKLRELMEADRETCD